MKLKLAIGLALACCLCFVTAFPVEHDENTDAGLIMPVEQEQPANFNFFFLNEEGKLKPLPIPQELIELLTQFLQPKYADMDSSGLTFTDNGIFYTDWHGNLKPLPVPEKLINLLMMLMKPKASIGFDGRSLFYMDLQGSLKPLTEKLSELLELLLQHSPEAVAPQARFTCDVLSFSILGTKFNHSACATHCRWLMHAGGHCDRYGVCNCRG